MERPQRKCKLASYQKKEFYQKATNQELKEAFEDSKIPISERPQALYEPTLRSKTELNALKQRYEFYEDFDTPHLKKKQLIKKAISKIDKIMISDLTRLGLYNKKRKRLVEVDGVDWGIFSENSISNITKILDEIEPKRKTRGKKAPKKQHKRNGVGEVEHQEMQHFVKTIENLIEEAENPEEKKQEIQMNDYTFSQNESNNVMLDDAIMNEFVSGWL